MTVPGMPDPSVVDGPGLEIMAGVSLQLGKLSDAMVAAQRREQRYQSAVMSVPIKPHLATVSGGGVLILSVEHDLGPPDGYVWAVQRISVAGLTGTDILTFYKGPPIAATVAATNQANIVTATAPTWNPGRTGLVLQMGDTLVASGSALAATSVCVSGEVIQLEQWVMPQFLL